MKRILFIFIAFGFLFPCAVYAESQTASGTSASVIIDDARAILNGIWPSGVTDPFWQDTRMLQWLNDGMVDISEKTKSMQDRETIYLVSGQFEYDFGSGGTCFEVYAVQYTDEDVITKGLLPGNPATVGLSPEDYKPLTTKYPKYYYEDNEKIGAYPPVNEISGTTPEYLTVFFKYRTTDIELHDLITIPATYDRALTFYIVSKGASKGGLYPTLAVLYKALYDEIIEFHNPALRRTK